MNRIKIKLGIKPLIVLSFMLFSVDVLGKGWYVFGISIVLTGLYIALYKRRIKVDTLFLWVALLSVSNYLIMLVNSSASIVTKTMKYLLSPLGGYLIGNVLATEAKDEENIFKLYMFAVIPYFIHGLLNMLTFRGIDSTGNRIVIDFWTGEEWKATLACTYFTMTIPLFFMSLVTRGWAKKSVFFLLAAFSVLVSIVTASRTVIYIGCIVNVIEIFMYVTMNKKTMLTQKIGVLAKVAIVAVIVASIVVYSESFSNSLFYERMWNSNLAEEPRLQLFGNVIRNALKYPFGNMPYAYSHNTWLDFLRESGWITFIFFCAITIIAVKDLVFVYLNRSIPMLYRISIVGMMVALLLQMFVEPVMDGAAILFCLFFYLIGVNNRFAKRFGENVESV